MITCNSFAIQYCSLGKIIRSELSVQTFIRNEIYVTGVYKKFYVELTVY